MPQPPVHLIYPLVPLSSVTYGYIIYAYICSLNRTLPKSDYTAKLNYCLNALISGPVESIIYADLYGSIKISDIDPYVDQ